MFAFWHVYKLASVYLKKCAKCNWVIIKQMSVAPAVLTEPILTTREAQPVVLVSSEEILTVRTPAYAKNAMNPPNP